LRIKKALGIFRELITTRRTTIEWLFGPAFRVQKFLISGVIPQERGWKWAGLKGRRKGIEGK